ncbi:MAG: hypothetical protein ACR2KE_08260 [Candidatus Nanopelagicales bacterium]
MSDDIERLLSEVGKTTPSSSRDVATSSRTPAPRDSAPGGRLAFALVAAVSLGLLTWVAGIFLPFIGGIDLGIGGAIGAFVAALIAGPPRWFSS